MPHRGSLDRSHCSQSRERWCPAPQFLCLAHLQGCGQQAGSGLTWRQGASPGRCHPFLLETALGLGSEQVPGWVLSSPPQGVVRNGPCPLTSAASLLVIPSAPHCHSSQARWGRSSAEGAQSWAEAVVPGCYRDNHSNDTLGGCHELQFL